MRELRANLDKLLLALILAAIAVGCGQGNEPLSKTEQPLGVEEVSKSDFDRNLREPTNTAYVELSTQNVAALKFASLLPNQQVGIVGSTRKVTSLRDTIVREGLATKTRIFYVTFRLYNNVQDGTVQGRIDTSHGRLDLVRTENFGVDDSIEYRGDENAVTWSFSPSVEEKQVTVRINASYRDVDLTSMRLIVTHGEEQLEIALKDLPKVPTQLLVKNNVHLSASGFNLEASTCTIGAISGQIIKDGTVNVFHGVWHDPVKQLSTEIEMVQNGGEMSGVTTNGKYPTGQTMNGDMSDGGIFFGTFTNKFANERGYFDGQLYYSTKDPTDVVFRGNWQAECIVP